MRTLIGLSMGLLGLALFTGHEWTHALASAVLVILGVTFALACDPA